MKVCPKCARSFAEGFQYCPQDANELVKYDLRVHLNRQSEFQFLLPSETLLVRLRRELSSALIEFKHNPRIFLAGLLRGEKSSRRRKRLLQAGVASAVIVYGAVMTAGLLIGLFTSSLHSIEAGKPIERNISDEPIFTIPLVAAKTEKTNKAKTNQGLLGGSLPKRGRAQGGGGGNDETPASKGVNPTPSLSQQLMKPDLSPPEILNPSLVVTPTIYADPKSFLKATGPIGLRNGQTETPSLGNGPGTGIGPGNGPGYGPGENGGVGGGKFKPGGGETTGTGNEIFAQTRDLRPTIIYKERAKYTEEARQNRIQGTVVLSLIFGADGRIHDIRPVHNLPYGLTEAAIEAAQKIRFNPALREGRPVNVRSQIEFNFTLY
ncbi:MAG: energy transducer TonB [Blastocatellales bacterium]